MDLGDGKVLIDLGSGFGNIVAVALVTGSKRYTHRLSIQSLTCISYGIEIRPELHETSTKYMPAVN